jgi:hypothetical protein
MVCSSLVDIIYVPQQCGFLHLMAILTLPIIHLYGEVVKSGTKILDLFDISVGMLYTQLDNLHEVNP